MRVQIGLCMSALLLGGCVPYRLSGSDLLEPNAQLLARGQAVPRPAPMTQAIPAPYRVTEERLAAGFGEIALTRVETDPDKPLIVFCGGSAFRQDERGAFTTRQLVPFGDVWTFDYPGYGRSDGGAQPAEFDALTRSLAARIDAAFAGERRGPLVFWGHSFGGGACARLAAAVRTPSDLVLVGAFRDYQSAVRARARRLVGPLALLVRPVIAPDVPNADMVETLRAYDGDVVVAAIREDRIVPFSASAELERALRSLGKRTQLVTFTGGDHVRFYAARDFLPRMRRALEAAGVRSPGQGG